MKKALLAILAILMIFSVASVAALAQEEISAEPAEEIFAEKAAYGLTQDWASRDGEPPVSERAESPVDFNEEMEVDFTWSEFAYFYIHAPEQARFGFYSRGSSQVGDSRDVVGYLFDEDWNLLIMNDDINPVINAGNFYFNYVLKSGHEYHLLVKAPRTQVEGVRVVISYTHDTTAAVLELDEEHVPDAAFRAALADQADMNEDGHLTEREVSLVHELDLAGLGIGSLEGIEYFPALQELNCSGNELTALDVSMFPELQKLRCYDNRLETLTLGGKPALYELFCQGNALTEVDLREADMLHDLIFRMQLREVSEGVAEYYFNDNVTQYCFELDHGVTILTEEDTYIAGEDDSLVHLMEDDFPDAALREALKPYDLNKNNGLSRQEIKRITSLGVTGCLSLRGVENLTAVNTLSVEMPEGAASPDAELAAMPALTDLTVAIAADGLDVSGCLYLERLEITSNGLQSLTLGNQPSLRYFRLEAGEGGAPALVDISGALLLLDTMENGSRTGGNSYMMYDGTEDYLSVPVGTALVYPAGRFVFVDEETFPDAGFREYIETYVDANQSGILSRSEIADVDNIYLDDESIASLEGIGHFTALRELSLSALPLLTEIDLRANTVLEELFCQSSGLETLDVSANAALKSLSCWNNSLTAIDVSHNPALTSLSVGQNQLTELDVSRNPKLESLDCGGNAITSLDVTELPELASLDCSDNPLSALDVSRNPKLSFFLCDGTSIKRLDLSGCPLLVDAYRAGVSGGSVNGVIYSNESGHLVVPDNAFIIASAEEWAAHEHEFDTVEYIVEPTCTEAGRAVYSCRCGESYEEDVEPHGHWWYEREYYRERSCDEDGVEIYICYWDHSHKDTRIDPAYGHSWGEWIVTKEATCTEDGERYRVCFYDNSHVETEVIPRRTAGWKQNSVGWWYDNGDGTYPVDEWKQIGGVWYYFKSDGYMAANEWVGGYWFGASGAWTYQARGSWKSNDKGWWYEDSSGWYPRNTWQKIDGQWYFFKANGYMAASEWYGGYWFGGSGAWTYQPRGSWQQNAVGWWFGDTSGWYAKNETLKINDVLYSFNAAGYWVQ